MTVISAGRRFPLAAAEAASLGWAKIPCSCTRTEAPWGRRFTANEYDSMEGCWFRTLSTRLCPPPPGRSKRSKRAQLGVCRSDCVIRFRFADSHPVDPPGKVELFAGGDFRKRIKRNLAAVDRQPELSAEFPSAFTSAEVTATYCCPRRDAAPDRYIDYNESINYQ